MDIITHEGKEYISADSKNDYITQTVEQIQTIQNEIDENQTQLDELEKIEQIEQRKAHVIKALSKYHDINIDDSLQLFDFENDDSIDSTLSYYEKIHQSDMGDPSAGFGPAKKAQSNTSKQLYEHGRQYARKIKEGRR